MQYARTGAFGGEIAVSEKFFEIALDDGYMSLSIRGFLNESAIFAQVFSAAIFSCGCKTSNSATSVVQETLDVHLAETCMPGWAYGPHQSV